MAPTRPSRPASPRSAGRERITAKGDATRLQILLTAERMFAEQGIAAVSLRAIASEAGQKNNAAVHYHFGDRENLLRAIVEYRVDLGEEVRARLLAQLVTDRHPVRPVDLMGVVVHSLAVYLTKDDHFLSFMSRYAVERGGFSGLEETPARNSLYTLQAILRPLVPECSESVLEERWMMMLTSALHTLARYQTAMHSNSLAGPLPELLDELVRFLTWGIEAAPHDVSAAN